MTTKTGDVIGVSILTEDSRKDGEVMLISKTGQTVRVPLNGVRTTSRVTQGVILAKLKDKKDSFTSATVMKKGDEEEEVVVEGKEEGTEE